MTTMRITLIVSFAFILTGCGTYEGHKLWRLGACKDIVDSDERSRCEDQATRSENEYKHDVDQALKN